jgi:hypothetical protein
MYGVIAFGIIFISSMDISISLSFHFISKNHEKINSILALNILMGILCALIIIPWIIFALTQLIKNWNVSMLTIGILVWMAETFVCFTLVLAILMVQCRANDVIGYEPVNTKSKERVGNYIS